MTRKTNTDLFVNCVYKAQKVAYGKVGLRIWLELTAFSVAAQPHGAHLFNHINNKSAAAVLFPRRKQKSFLSLVLTG
jgi:hypothetical protein